MTALFSCSERSASSISSIRCRFTVDAIGPGRGPGQLRLRPLHQRHPGRSRSLICHHDGFHSDTSLYQSSPTRHLGSRISAARDNRVRWPGSARSVSRGQTSSGPRTIWTAASSALAPRHPSRRQRRSGRRSRPTRRQPRRPDVPERAARAAGAARRTWDSVVSRRIRARGPRSRPHEAQSYYPADGPFT